MNISNNPSIHHIAQILGDIDAGTVEAILNGRDTIDRDLSALQELAIDARTKATHLLGDQLTPKELEDAGATQLGLPTISVILDEYEELRTIRNSLVRSIAVTTGRLFELQEGEAPNPEEPAVTLEQDVLTPPGDMPQHLGPGPGIPFLKEFQERLTTLLLILYDLGIDVHDASHVHIHIGSVRANMMRSLTYASVFVPRLQRLIELCNEVGNRSFVWHATDAEDIHRFSQLTKEEKQEYLMHHPGSGSDLVMRKGWEAEMRSLLQESLSRPVAGTIQKNILETHTRLSEALRWQQNLEQLLAFRHANPDTWPSSKTPLYAWLRKQKTKMRDGTLSIEQVQALQELGVKPAERRGDITRPFDEWLSELQVFRHANPDTWPSSKTPLNEWLRKQKTKMRDGTLSIEQVQALQELGVKPAERRGDITRPFDEWLSELQVFRHANPDTWPPHGIALTTWFQKQKKKMRDGTLTDEQLQALQDLGVKPAERISSFDEWLSELQVFRHANPGTCPPHGTSLAAWFQKQKEKMRDGKLTDEQLQALQELGVKPAERREDITRPFDEWLSELQVFRHANPDTWPSRTPIGQWLHWQKQKMRDGKLSYEQVRALQELGVKPAERNRSFDEWLSDLQIFRHTNSDIWPDHRTPLGQWLHSQKQKMRDGKLSDEQVRALQELGVKPAERQDDITRSFEDGLSELRSFRQSNSDIWPHRRTSLGNWLQKQKTKMRDGKLTDEQVRALRDLGVEAAKKYSVEAEK